MLKLHWFQEAAISALWKCWREAPHCSPLIVAPTGSGKSVMIASIIAQIREKNPARTFLIVTHTKEIVRQNAEQLRGLLETEEPIGIYSAGLKSKTITKITFANIQSIRKAAAKLSKIDLCIIDEAHLVSQNEQSMYQKLIAQLRLVNPEVRIMGLTATPMRMDQGSLLAPGSVFDTIAYDISIKALIESGFLAPLISKAKKAVDLTGVQTSGHDYNQGQLEQAFNKPELLDVQCKEIVANSEGRKHWLIFCSGIAHAATVAERLKALGVAADYVTGEMVGFERDLKINAFMEGKTQVLCNVGVLTTGFNFKPIDMVVLLRSTKSASLYIQSVGRGTRTAEGKKDCLVLDFGGNITRHGPIDMIKIKVHKTEDGGGKKVEIEVAPTKKCPKCDCVVLIAASICASCDFVFPIPEKQLRQAASTKAIISTGAPQLNTYSVVSRSLSRHKGKAGKRDSLKVTYQCMLGVYSEYVCLEHGGWATEMARAKWRTLLQAITTPPYTINEALTRESEIPTPETITIDSSQKYPRIVKTEGKKEAIEDIEVLADDWEHDQSANRYAVPYTKT